jgi:hypothetical protein
MWAERALGADWARQKRRQKETEWVRARSRGSQRSRRASRTTAKSAGPRRAGRGERAEQEGIDLAMATQPGFERVRRALQSGFAESVRRRSGRKAKRVLLAEYDGGGGNEEGKGSMPGPVCGDFLIEPVAMEAANQAN